MTSALIAAAAVLTAGLSLGVLLLLRRRLRGGPTVAAYFAAAAAAAVLAGTSVAALPSVPGLPGPGRAAGTPVLDALAVGSRRVPVLVVPGRPGRNLVAVGAESAAAGVDPARLARGGRRPGSTLTWVSVDLPAGRSTVWVSAGGAVGAVSVDAGDGDRDDNRDGAAHRDAAGPGRGSAGTGGDPGDRNGAFDGPDGPECASAAAGAVLAGATGELSGCPADRLTERDAAALRAMVAHLAAGGARAVALTADRSPRGRAAAAEVRAAAARAQLTVTGPGTRSLPLVVVSGWAGADSVLRSVGAGRTPARGTYLAPWLFSSPLLQPAAGQILPLRYSPRTAETEQYLDALGTRLPGEAPTAAGYEAWCEERGRGPASPVRLYATAVVYIPGMGSMAGHRHHGSGSPVWLPSGMISPVSGPLKAT